MKNLLLVSGIVFVLLSSCKKDDNSPIYSQDQLNGTWENIQLDENDCKNQLIIFTSGMSEKTICEASSVSIDYDSYLFDGKKITASFFGISVTFTINELTDSKLILTLSSLGSNEKNEYKKI